MDVYKKSLALHKEHGGKLEVIFKVPLVNKDDLSLAYTPGVAEPCREIAKDKTKAYEYTIKANSVAVVTDGSAVLGLGNIGAVAGLPVMEGKALLFKAFGGIDAYPICVDTQDTEEFIRTVKNITPGFGGINLEDIAAPRCFEIEERLKAMCDIPIFHDDQHGTAIVVLAGLINAFKIKKITFADAKIVISGAGAAGMASLKLLLSYGVKNILVCDRTGIISKNRPDIKDLKYKLEIVEISNPNNEDGTLTDALKGADVFIGVSGPNIATTEMISKMNPDAVVFAMANPTPEIMPDAAKAGGALIVCTGRSDFPNQINNVLAFPGIFKGAFMAGAKKITEKMKLAAAEALAKLVKNPTAEKVLPGVFEEGVCDAVAMAVKNSV